MNRIDRIIPIFRGVIGCRTNPVHPVHPVKIPGKGVKGILSAKASFPEFGRSRFKFSHFFSKKSCRKTSGRFSIPRHPCQSASMPMQGHIEGVSAARNFVFIRRRLGAVSSGPRRRSFHHLPTPVPQRFQSGEIRPTPPAIESPKPGLAGKKCCTLLHPIAPAVLASSLLSPKQVFGNPALNPRRRLLSCM